jgi:biopolymer transport protein ExbD
MGHKRRKNTDLGKDVEGGAEMDMTPMIDITFQLIVFFLVANDLTRKEVEELKLPQAIYGQEDKATEKDLRVIINILKPENTADPPKIPQVKVKGKEYDLKDLTRYMRSMADLEREGEGVGAPSAIYVLIRADKETPWQHVQYVMQVCAEPTIAIYKMQFATTKREDGRASQAGGAPAGGASGE